jgi:hypothetical protein
VNGPRNACYAEICRSRASDGGSCIAENDIYHSRAVFEDCATPATHANNEEPNRHYS